MNSDIENGEAGSWEDQKEIWESRSSWISFRLALFLRKTLDDPRFSSFTEVLWNSVPDESLRVRNER